MSATINVCLVQLNFAMYPPDLRPRLYASGAKKTAGRSVDWTIVEYGRRHE